jgi:hypothetical protein
MSATTESASEPQPSGPVRIASPASLLAVIPHLLGFAPQSSLVVIGAEEQRGEVKIVLRYDLPDPPTPEAAAESAAHATEILAAQRITCALVAGYGPDRLVAPLAAALRSDLHAASIAFLDLLRVEDQRYWSYLCSEKGCCPPDGTAFDVTGDAAGAALAAEGQVLASRSQLAQTIAAVDGEAAESMRRATQRAEDQAREFISRLRGKTPARARRLLASAGIEAMTDAIGIYRQGNTISDDDQIAWLTVMLGNLRVRDDAWARMDPEHREAHQRLWTDLTRRACRGHVAAPASLLAFVAWQRGNGALANLALDRALTDRPRYSMAGLLGGVMDGGVPRSAARLPMSPEEVAASYDEIDDQRTNDREGSDQDPPWNTGGASPEEDAATAG